MTELYEKHLCNLPTEIYMCIFELLSSKELMKCRKVCRRWKDIIDPRAQKDGLWREFTRKDFAKVYRVAIRKSYGCKQWFDIYRSLSLWPHINSSIQSRDEFASASRIQDEIRDFVVLRNGIIGIHTKVAIDYYSIETLEKCDREPMQGDFNRYAEIDDTIIILGNHLHLHILRKIRNPNQEPSITFADTKMFFIADRKIFFVNLNNEIFLFDLDKDSAPRFLKRYEGIMTLSYCEGILYALTFQRTVCKLVGSEMIYVCLLDNVYNFLDCLRKYNFLENVDWRVYFQWMVLLQLKVPEGPLGHTLTIYPYGDVYLVGSKYGVLRLYIAPYTDGELDLFNNDPVKQFNFMERSDCPVLSVCPIYRIDVMEVIDGHKVIVAMPKKIAVITFKHNFDKEVSFKVHSRDRKCSGIEL